MGKRNEEGENVSAIYDSEGLLTSITLNCGELSKMKLPQAALEYVDGIQHMVATLVASVRPAPRFEVETWLTQGEYKPDIKNGTVGPFETHAAAERALVALCQAGKATSGQITAIDED